MKEEERKAYLAQIRKEQSEQKVGEGVDDGFEEVLQREKKMESAEDEE
jgi:hypothetical protein